MKEKTLKTKTMNQNQIKSESVILSKQEKYVKKMTRYLENKKRREEKNDPSNKIHKCPICGKEFKGYGNNPYPVKDKGRCCDECNRKYVITTRLLVDEFSNSNNKDAQREAILIEKYMKGQSFTWIQDYLRPYFPNMIGDNNNTVGC